MLNIKKIYEAQQNQLPPAIKHSDQFRRILYSIGNFSDVFGILTQKVNMTHNMKLVKDANFDPKSKTKPMWSFDLKPGTCVAKLGDDMEYGVEPEKIDFFEKGLASVKLNTNDDFTTAVVNYLDLKERIGGSYDDELKKIKREIEKEFDEQNKFDPENVFKINDDAVTKDKLRNQKQAVAKKMSNIEKNKQSAIRRAVEKYNRERDEKILEECKLDKDVVRILLNGSLTEEGVLFWYPTVLDLCRMLPESATIPTELAIAVNDNDQNYRPNGNFAKDVLFEAWSELTDGKSAFDEIRDSLHRRQGGLAMIHFPDAKPKRWSEFKKLANATDVPREEYDGIKHEKTKDSVYGTRTLDGEKITVGDLGEIFCFVDNMSGVYQSLKCAILKKGVVMLYDRNDNLVTAMFVPPEQLIKTMKYSENVRYQSQPAGIPVKMLRDCVENFRRMTAGGDSAIFVRGSGTRRYIA